MPFITEECNEYFFKSKKHLIVDKWPRKIELKKSENIIELIRKIISAIRVFRVENNFSFKIKIDLSIYSQDINKLDVIKKILILLFFWKIK